MGSSGSKSGPVCDYDSDNESMLAYVYFVLDNVVGIGAHWSVVFDFGRFYIKTEGCPAGEVFRKVLKPGYTRTTSKPEGTYVKFTDLGAAFNFDFVLNLGKFLISIMHVPKIQKVKISPNKIYNLCKNNGLNNKKYILGVVDCQCWALLMADYLKDYEC